MLKEQDFSTALCALKSGKKVRRKGWNGSTYLDTAKHQQFLPRIYMYKANQPATSWLASQEDMLAEDWQIMTLKATTT